MLNGIKRGIQHMAAAIGMRYRAQRAGNMACTQALDAVFAQWFEDATGVALSVSGKGDQVKIGIGNLLFGDPFKPSRDAFFNVQKLFPTI